MAIKYIQEMKILVVGGGIAGLTLAALLQQRGAKALSIIEKAAHYSEAGYVLAIWPPGSRILKGLGLYDRFADESISAHTYQVADVHGNVLHRYSFEKLTREYGPCLCVERSQLIKVLAAGLQQAPQMGLTVKNIKQTDDEAVVEFSDGTEQSYDLVIGCDGLRSGVRKFIDDTPLNFMGATGWGFWIDEDKLDIDGISEYWGAGQFFGIYPAKNKVCVFAAVSSKPGQKDPAEERIQKIRDSFGNMGGLVPDILANLTNTDQIFHDDFNDIKIQRWYQGRVCLVGDAAHGILPSAGMGASLAMESAAVLADELTRADSNQLEQTFARYVKRRRPRVDKLQDESRLLWKMMFVNNQSLAALRNLLLRHYSEEAFFKTCEPFLADPI